MELDVQVVFVKLALEGVWNQTNDGLKIGMDGGGMVRASICVACLMVGRASGTGLEHASPNTSKRLTSSSLMLTLPDLSK